MIEGSQGGGINQVAGLSKIQEAELFGLRNDVQKLLNENDSLHGRMTSMQGELMYMLKMKVEDKGGEDNIASVLLTANEGLMRELMGLRSAMANNMTRRDSEIMSDLDQNQGQFQGGGYIAAGMLRQSGRLPPAGGRKPPSTPRAGSDGSHNDTMFTPVGNNAPLILTLSLTLPLSLTLNSTHFTLPHVYMHIMTFNPPNFFFLGPRNSSYTPNMATGALNATGGFSAGPGYPPVGPNTPHGKMLLTKNLNQMNLPPEEWALEVRTLHIEYMI